MFLHQASLIPSTIALLDFFNKSFPNFFWYPYWYLGNPFNYLIGPVVPFLSFLLGKMFDFTPEQSFWSLFLLSLTIGSSALYVFTRKLGMSKWVGLAIVTTNIFLPFTYIMLNFQNGLSHISFFLLPVVFLIFIDFLKKNSLFFDLLLVFLISFLVLIDISVIVSIFISLISLSLVLKERKLWFLTFLKLFFILLASFFLISSWYTFGFWFNLASNPSLGGRPLINIIGAIFDLSLRLIPIIAAVWVVRLGTFRLKTITYFGLLLTLSFGFLTILRLLSDPDFILDWIIYAQELQLGITLLLGGLFLSLKIKTRSILTVLVILCSILGWVKFYSLIKDSSSSEFKLDILNLIKVEPKDNFFFSGSSVFFINQYKDLVQLRGGNDSSSVHPTWAMASYQIREGSRAQVTKNWLKALGISKVLVHNSTSKDFYLDFKNPEKFENLKPIANSNGNILYEISGNNIARAASQEILNIKQPVSGEDSIVLEAYIKSLGENINIERNIQTIRLKNIPEGVRVISLAVTYQPSWKALYPGVEIISDNLGNMVILSESELPEIIRIEYNPSIFSHTIPILFFTIMLYIIFKFKLIANFILKKISLN